MKKYNGKKPSHIKSIRYEILLILLPIVAVSMILLSFWVTRLQNRSYEAKRIRK